MALFEARAGETSPPDDTRRLRVVVKQAHTRDNHTEYVLVVTAGAGDAQCSWSVSRRYREFAALHAALTVSGIAPALPPKRLLGNMQPAFVADRQRALQNYLTEVLARPLLALSLQVRRFLDPHNYSQDIHEMALASVSGVVRGADGVRLEAALPDVGWRIRKRYFLTRSATRGECLTCWMQYGPDLHLHDRDLHSALSYLRTLSEAAVLPILNACATRGGAVVVRSLRAGSTVRDLLYGGDHRRPHLARRARGCDRRPMCERDVATYGRHVLEALLYLHAADVPYGHLHVGNVAIVDSRAVLSDVENGLLGVPSAYRPYLVQHRNVSTMEAVDAYCFGHLLYEMTFAEPLESVGCETFLSQVSRPLESVLRMCLCRRGPPALASLLQQELFAAGVCERDGLPPPPRAPSHLRRRMRDAAAAIESRIAEDHKSLRSEERLLRIQRALSSDEGGAARRGRRVRGAVSCSSLAEPEPSASSSTSSSPPPTARTALLSAICSFDKAGLQPVVT